MTHGNDLGVTDVAEHTLLALRRARLVRSWRCDGSLYTVEIGRGTLSPALLDAAGVTSLGRRLRRDRVTVACPRYLRGHRTYRYHLSDGRFTDRHDARRDRYLDQYPYSVFVPGAHSSGTAALHFAARTLAEATALAGFARVRGRCALCGSQRPLQARTRRPDTGVPCPGCAADSLTPVTLECAGCHNPIVRVVGPPVLPWRASWVHTATRSPFCDSDHAIITRPVPQRQPTRSM